jgi:putative PIN family toxin of toxin-antitoxin system
MRLVLDTNVVVAGLLWDGPPRKILERAIDDGTLELYSSPALIDELRNTLGYRKFARRIADHRTSIDALLAQYRALLILVSPLNKPRAVPRDPDDNEVLALAVAAQVVDCFRRRRPPLARSIPRHPHCEACGSRADRYCELGLRIGARFKHCEKLYSDPIGSIGIVRIVRFLALVSFLLLGVDVFRVLRAHERIRLNERAGSLH